MKLGTELQRRSYDMKTFDEHFLMYYDDMICK